MRHLFAKADSPTRRDFLAATAKATLGVTALGYPGSALATDIAHVTNTYAPAKRLIYLYMGGGMSQLDTFTPKPEASKYIKGPLKAISTSADGVQVSELLPITAKQMHNAAVIETMSSNQGAHEQGAYIMHTNYAMRGTIEHPGIGSWISHLGGKINPALPPGVVIGGGSRIFGSGYMETKHSPLPIGRPDKGLDNSYRPENMTEEDYHRRLNLSLAMSKQFMRKYNSRSVRAYKDVYLEALRLMKSEDLEVFDISKEPEYIREAYGSDSFGQGCLLARRLVERNVRYVEVRLGGWDTHTNNFTALEDRASKLDRGLGTLLADLSARGLLEETMVVLTTEFGRTPDINEADGRDHYPTIFTSLLAGGGIAGGQVYGKSSVDGKEVVENKVTVADFHSTIGHAMGLAHEQRTLAPNGRPFTMGNKGKPLAIF
jgi:uncharacterized protein (DUF1501 family)